LKKLTANEKSLISLQLTHIISLASEDESTMLLVLDSIEKLINIKVPCDYEFGILEGLLTHCAKQSSYTNSVIEKTKALIITLPVSMPEHQMLTLAI
jgi:hypothetical protein